MKKNNDFLSDIEYDIERDWNDIRKEILKKEEKEEKEEILKNKSRPYFPSFDEFYEVLVELGSQLDVNTNEYKYSLHRLLRGILNNHNNVSLPNTFKKIWEMFCDPIEYQFTVNISCKRCMTIYDVVYKKQRYNIIPFVDDIPYEDTKVSTKRIHCIECGEMMAYMNGIEDLIGIFKSSSPCKILHGGKDGFI